MLGTFSEKLRIFSAQECLVIADGDNDEQLEDKACKIICFPNTSRNDSFTIQTLTFKLQILLLHEWFQLRQQKVGPLPFNLGKANYPFDCAV